MTVLLIIIAMLCVSVFKDEMERQTHLLSHRRSKSELKSMRWHLYKHKRQSNIPSETFTEKPLKQHSIAQRAPATLLYSFSIVIPVKQLYPSMKAKECVRLSEEALGEPYNMIYVHHVLSQALLPCQAV